MPKLTLRDLFALVTVVALALGWWLDHQELTRSKDFANQKLLHAELNAAVDRERLEWVEEMFIALARKFEPERIGHDFEFSIDDEDASTLTDDQAIRTK